MSIYYFIFIWIAVMACFSQYVNVTKRIKLHGQIVYRWKLGYAFLVFIPVLYLVALTPARSDTVLYLSIYNNLPTSLEGLFITLESSESGYGFVIFEWMLKNITGGSEIFFRGILAILHSIPVLYVFRKYSCNYLISFYLFIASGCHIAWMMNGLRQFLAVSIVMLCTPLVLKKKYFFSILIILVAASIHSSAILMIPVIFIVQGKPWNKKTLLFIVLAVIMMYLFSRYTGLLDTMLENTEYAGVMASAQAMGDDGVNPIRVLVNSIPMIFALIGKRYLEQDDDPVINMCVNMSVITVGLYLVAMVTSGVMLGRLPIYTSLYSYILLPYLIKRIFTEKSATIVLVAMIFFYFLYYLYAYRSF